MKRKWLTVLLLCVIGFYVFPQSRITLERAINSSAREISNALPNGTRIAVLNVSAPSVTMSEHVIEELNDQLVSLGNLAVVGQRNLGLIRQEMNYQLSGSVSDETQQSIGKILDLEMVVSGSMETSKKDFQYLVQVLEVGTGAIKYSKAYRIKNNHEMQTLMAGGRIIRNYTPGERAGAAVLNLFFGLGSVALQRDASGAVFPMICQFYGGFLAGAGLLGLFEDSSEDAKNDDNFDVSKVFMYAGIGVYSLGAIVGIIRALTHNRPGAFLSQMDVPPLNLALVPDGKGKPAVQLSYTMQF